MVILLDTHILVWAWTDDPRLKNHHRKLVASPDQKVVVSAVSIWELAIKNAIGKLDLDLELETLVAALPKFGFTVLPMEVPHALEVKKLPHHHRDPFDRILIAQANYEGMHILTADKHFKAYDVNLVGG